MIADKSREGNRLHVSETDPLKPLDQRTEVTVINDPIVRYALMALIPLLVFVFWRCMRAQFD
jgi:hypothetical protein